MYIFVTYMYIFVTVIMFQGPQCTVFKTCSPNVCSNTWEECLRSTDIQPKTKLQHECRSELLQFTYHSLSVTIRRAWLYISKVTNVYILYGLTRLKGNYCRHNTGGKLKIAILKFSRFVFLLICARGVKFLLCVLIFAGG